MGGNRVASWNAASRCLSMEVGRLTTATLTMVISDVLGDLAFM